MKKTIVLFLMILMITLTSCTSGAGSDALTFWAYEPQSLRDRTAYNQLISQFEAENDVTVRVSWVPKDSYNQRLNTALRNNRTPDVAYLDQPLTASFVENDRLVDVTNYLSESNTISAENFYSAALDTVEINGRYYGLPLTVGTSVLLYNETLVTNPSNIVSWDTWLEAAQDLSTSQIAAFEGIGAGGYAGWYFGGFLTAAGGQLMNEELTEVTFNSTAGVQAAEFLKALYDLSPNNIINSTSAFGNGRVLFKLGGGSDVASIRTNFPNLNFGAMLMPPTEAGGASYSNIGGDNLVIFESSDKKDLAFKLVEFLNSNENALDIAEFTGNFPANEQAIGDAYADDEILLTLLQQLETATIRPKISGWIEVNDAYLGTALETIFSGQRTAQAALDLARDQAHERLF